MKVLLSLYPWLLAFHVIAMIAFMAGMLYLPRLFVYHAMTEPGTPQSETFKLMERRLLRFIINPSLLATVLAGLLLCGVPGVVDYSLGWFWVKIAAFSGLVMMHIAFARWARGFAVDNNQKRHRFFRIWNEAPTILMAIIVVMAIVKPF